MVQQTYDFVVVGGGSAGCVITHRLVRAGHSVLLLEAGPNDDSMFVQMPATFVRVIGTERSWIYETEPQAGAAGRKMAVPQGRMLGGGSSLNAMVYMRGTREDYDGWARQGCAGWGWDEVLEVFKRAESNQRLSQPLHGTDGPLKVSDTRFRHPLSLAFVKGAQEAGLAYNDDFNGVRQTGVGFYQTTTVGGQRGSTAATYLAAVQGNPRLTVVTGAHVLKLSLRGAEVTGVEYRTKAGTATASAAKEVILAAGALATPKILMLSGIGPGAHLQSLGIPVLRDLPGVGGNYHDHLEVGVYGRARDPISLFGNDRGLKAFKHGVQWKLFRTGLLTSNVVESGAFVDTLGAGGRPDMQFHVLPTLVGDVDREPLGGHGISLNPCFLHPKSRGTVRLRSTDPMAPIVFDAAALREQADVDALVRGVKLARRILRTPSMSKLISEELEPGRDEAIADQALEDYVRRRAKTVYHPVGTCKMGVDAEAVVDPQLRVHGVARLRVCDASVFPTIMSGNTNAPVIMVAERCGDFIVSGAR
ncbi:MAG: Alcohol dehydrogenase [acceptor] [Burkholderiaceae bacterium]|nr:Alcohol dehydrogenase [acceptor] [Burkholderiaceae bacterium]